MKLWTFQPVEVYEKLMQEGRIVCDISKSDMYHYPRFAKAYNWLIDQMLNKISRPDDVKYPMWAWYQWNGKNIRPDRRYLLFKYRSQEEALISLEVPDDLVLLSNYDLWHNILNDGVILDTDEEYDYAYEVATSEEFRKIQERTWPIVLSDLGKYTQACIWDLRKEWVTGVKIYPARKFNE